MIRKILSKLVQKSGLARPEKWLKETLGIEETWSGVEITAEGALASSTVTACVRLLSESVASLPLHVYRRDSNGKMRAPEHPIYSLLHSKPNDYQTSWAWRAHMMVCALLHGNAYSVVERDQQGRIVALWPLDPRTVTVKAKDGHLIYEAYIASQKQVFRYGDVLHIKGPSLDGIVGMSVIKLARQGIGLDLAQAQYGASLYKNKARPGIILKHPEKLDDVTKEGLRNSFTEKFAGALNAGKIVVLEGGMELSPVGFSADDAQYLQSRQFSVQEVARWFKVNPHLVGDPSRLAYASSEAEFNAYLVHSLGPWLRNIESEMCSTLLPDRTQFLIEFDPNGMARGSQAERYAAYQTGLSAGFLTAADVRAAENLPFIPGTDQLSAAQTKGNLNVAA